MIASMRPLAGWLCLAIVTGFIAVAVVGCGVAPGGSGPSVFSQAPASDAVGVAAAQSVGPSTAEIEQLMLERVNRARLHPAEEAASDGITIDEGIPNIVIDTHPRQPVAYNATLAQAARLHADDMLANDYFAHQDLSGATPSDRIAATGYAYSTTGENLVWNGTTATLDDVASVERMQVELFADTTVPGRGHRLVMLYDNFREVGISIRHGTFAQNNVTYNALMAVQDYATRASAVNFYILGVAYDDRNNNRQYDAGEGISNVLVRLDGNGPAVNTAAGGGYSFAVAPGKHSITFGSGAPRDITISDKNVKVDLVNGSRIDVNLGLNQF